VCECTCKCVCMCASVSVCVEGGGESNIVIMSPTYIVYYYVHVYLLHSEP
jgi:hypothetical protein